uniref:Glycosyltransferase 2-like domain-containing protein n=1 Tax=viral metagenome TaxID=1070528 RepID=A0A6C0C6B5_9ZZZZ
MGKKNRKNKKVSANGKPFVSICTPTYNRRRFIPFIIKCFKSQNYPTELMEWIVVDDGTDPVGDLFEDVSGVKYFYQEEKMKLGRKRNYMHEKAKGDIILYMDDDDFYPPDRVNHVVNRLRSRPDALACGSSALYIYFQKQKEIYLFGPYGPNHATAGTFGFWRKLLKETSYEDDADMAEEKHFLKNYTIPFVQLNPMKSILVFAHDANTFDKTKLLMNPHPDYVKKTKLQPKNFIKDKEMVKFYIEQ